MKQVATAQQVISTLDVEFVKHIEEAVKLVVRCLKSNGGLYLVGNGGSAADAQHWAGELVGRFMLEREPLRACALTTNTSILTALVNDYPPEYVFARQMKAMARQGDVLIAISTSGNSPNIIYAIDIAREIGCQVIGFTGKNGGRMNGICDVLIKAPSDSTPRIQEVHLLAGHMLCAGVERIIFGI
ncbi:D-sedoheptulose 7-phosphate isomerase [Pelotomaculum isophthalicicum JI]|uniref:D-sedoheptulose 7-phosphate isomerase n=1 Tax=Pelotomaculum isophthalicicum JI TaxID=947010 RepID=A0A9X4JTS9_9FIRM|nr:D-sedoheptulose 7-phosphate isomerase [Pelotomaculum isophthalicicum]MDF9407900.1 D-sedoheptulose 7-phosphate isomerase [Pelotomaculum isophthalicicum JI]